MFGSCYRGTHTTTGWSHCTRTGTHGHPDGRDPLAATNVVILSTAVPPSKQHAHIHQYSMQTFTRTLVPAGVNGALTGQSDRPCVGVAGEERGPQTSLTYKSSRGAAPSASRKGKAVLDKTLLAPAHPQGQAKRKHR